MKAWNLGYSQVPRDFPQGTYFVGLSLRDFSSFHGNAILIIWQFHLHDFGIWRFELWFVKRLFIDGFHECMMAAVDWVHDNDDQ